VDPPSRGGVKGGVIKGGSDPPPQKGGRDSGFFWGAKNGQNWSKKVRDGGVSKSAVSGGRGGDSRKKNVGAWGAESLKILSPPPPPGGPKNPPGGVAPPPPPPTKIVTAEGGGGGGHKMGVPDPMKTGLKKVRDGGVSKSAVSGGRGGYSRKKNVGACGAESLKILSPPPPPGQPKTPRPGRAPRPPHAARPAEPRAFPGGKSMRTNNRTRFESEHMFHIVYF
jgi:hypothetical protein